MLDTLAIDPSAHLDGKGTSMIKGLKALQLQFEQAQTAAKMCDSPGCFETTREGKTYCSNHIEMQPYVRDLLKRMEQRHEEDEMVRREGSVAVNLEGITVKEIKLQLSISGSRTEERLTRELQIDKTVIHNYAIRLNKEGLVEFGRTLRNNLTVNLKNFDPSKVIDDDDDGEESS